MGMLIFWPRAPMLPNYPLTWVKLVIFITQIWFYSQKPKKVILIQLKSAKPKIKKIKGDKIEGKLNDKSQEGVKGDKINLIGTWLIEYLGRYEHMRLERCAPLGEVAPSWGGSPQLKEVAPSPWIWFHLTHVWSVERWHPTLPHLAAQPLTHGAPSLKMPCAPIIGNSTQMCINKRSLFH